MVLAVFTLPGVLRAVAGANSSRHREAFDPGWTGALAPAAVGTVVFLSPMSGEAR